MSSASISTSPELSRRDRFLAFAFAASDLLVEVAADGTIDFAAGAFNARFGSMPELFIGRHMRHLFCVADHGALDLAMFITSLRGRLPPLILRLSDPQGTSVSVSGLALPSQSGRMSFALGRLPRLPAPVGEDHPMDFARLLEQRVRSQEGGTLSLLELESWSDARSNLPAETHQALQAEITEVLAKLGGPGAIAGEIAEGRYGVLSDHPSNLQTLAAELEALLLARNPSTTRTKVNSTELSLDRGGLTGPQAARALRFALARFADGGVRATDAAGFRDSLADFVASAEVRARLVRSSISEGRFRLAYQPVVHLATREVHHYEALLRPIFEPGTAIQNTQDFVTFAEAVGLAEELDLAVMQQAMIAAGNSPKVRVAVNVSGLSMQSVPFREQMLRILTNSAGNTAGRLLVELTETADIEDVASAAESVATLRASKIPVCIDDFGAGSAAFRYLREFRVDYVKLDGAYVRGALHNAREHGFLLSMVELANFVGAKVIAETIETEPQAKLMHEVGVEYGQGWLFGRPGSLPGLRSSQMRSTVSAPAKAAAPRSRQ
jgi:EAL domain-containing protein (putative c-di-GMP-specific phosphodiesterase class I)